ncbi:MAG: hypothetical protein EP343_03665 [Deltaproteobacteria bacterium]|nr:MAG: hypothetical protein EP343_03665 [Deltaproteobacteria bacterium]
MTKASSSTTPPSRPVIMVRGFLATIQLMKPLFQALEDRGFEMHQAQLQPLCVQDVKVLAQQLSEEVDAILADRGVTQCDMVAVSKGGLIALYYLRKVMKGNKVRNFVALGSPFKGTRAAMVGIPLLGAISKGIWQTLPNADLLQEIEQQPPGEQVNLTSIALEGDRIVPPESCELKGATMVLVPHRTNPFAHQMMIFDSQVHQYIAEALRTER